MADRRVKAGGRRGAGPLTPYGSITRFSPAGISGFFADWRGDRRFGLALTPVALRASYVSANPKRATNTHQNPGYWPGKKGCRNGAGGRSKEEKAKNINKTLD